MVAVQELDREIWEHELVLTTIEQEKERELLENLERTVAAAEGGGIAGDDGADSGSSA
jgi:hypothetical protein